MLRTCMKTRLLEAPEATQRAGTSAPEVPGITAPAREQAGRVGRLTLLVFAAAVVAPRSPRRVFGISLMTLADQLRLMVLTDPVLLKGRDAVDVCRRAAES